MIELLGKSKEELRELCASLGQPAYRADQIYHALYSERKFDIGAMSEFDVALLVDEYAGEETSHKIYPQWRGGYYYAGRPKADPAAPLALLYLSRWATPESASEFAAIYANSLKNRFPPVWSKW